MSDLKILAKDNCFQLAVSKAFTQDKNDLYRNLERLELLFAILRNYRKKKNFLIPRNGRSTFIFERLSLIETGSLKANGRENMNEGTRLSIAMKQRAGLNTLFRSFNRFGDFFRTNCFLRTVNKQMFIVYRRKF